MRDEFRRLLTYVITPLLLLIEMDWLVKRVKDNKTKIIYETHLKKSEDPMPTNHWFVETL